MKRVISIKPADDILHRYENQIAALGEKQARVAMTRAVNRVTRSVYGKVVRAAAKQSGIPVKIVRDTVKMTLAAHKGNGPIEGMVHATGKQISLKHFGARQFSWGVRAKVWGEFKRYEGDFINAGRWNSGNPAFGGHVMYREGKDRFPVKRELGPSVPQAIIEGEAAHAFATTVETMLPARLTHELSRMLAI